MSLAALLKDCRWFNPSSGYNFMIKTEKIVATDIAISTVLLKDTPMTYNTLAVKNLKKLQEFKIQFISPFMLNLKKK